MYSPHVVTVYHASENPETLANEWNITVLDGVFLEVSQGAGSAKDGRENTDAATLYIPFAVKAVNAVTGEAQTYVPPKQYDKLCDKSRHWTVRAGGTLSASDCFFVKGRVAAQTSFQEINRMYDDVYRVVAVDTCDYGSPGLWHWKVSGR